MPLKTHYIIIVLLLAVVGKSFGQVSFSVYSDYDITVGVVPDLDFGEFLVNEGIRTITLGDPEMVSIPVTGVEYYDIIVTINADPNLTLGGDVIPLTIEAAYANRGNDNVTEAVLFDGNTAKFRLRAREDGPPGPPPTPPFEGYTPPEATAYIYLYGSVTVGNVGGGLYTGNVEVIIEYD